MRIGRVLHQQIMQLRYHFLACVGLIMVLPVEEAIVSYSEGRGYYFAHLSLFALCLGPLLTALIACATVQADLDEKCCLFWQSKPVRAHVFMTVKFATGLVLAMFVLACPLVFLYALNHLSTAIMPFSEFAQYSVSVALVSVLTYSICFFCNVLIRKTARAWLIGLATAGFVLLVPFLLPLPIQDVVTDVVRWMSGAYLMLTLGASVLAFCLGLWAVHYHWHLQTNLRGLLWAGAGLIFMVAILLGRQVANIKILDEVTITNASRRILVKEPGHYALGYHDVTVLDNRISVRDLYRERGASGQSFLREPLQTKSSVREVDEDLGPSSISNRIGLTYRIGEQEYSLGLSIYYQLEKVLNMKGREVTHKAYKKIRLSSSQTAGPLQGHISTIDLSDGIIEKRDPYPAMRRIEDKLIVFLYNQCLVVSIKEGGELELAEKNPYLRMYRLDSHNPFSVPLVPAAGVDMGERVKLSLDLVVRPGPAYWNRYHIHNSSLVSESDGQMRFAKITRSGLARYDVLGWDQEKVRCQFRDARAFLFGGFSRGEDHFVQDGKFYVFSENTLMVLDMLADRGIRKLGHLQRFSEFFCIEDIAVEENGNIVLLSSHGRGYDVESGQFMPNKSTLYLLKGP